MTISATKLVGLFALGAVTLSAALFVVWFVFGRSLNNDVRRMLATMAELDSVAVKTELIAEGVDDLPLFPAPSEDMTVRFGSRGVFDLSQLPEVTTSEQFALQTSVEGAEVAGEYRKLPSSSYLYISTAPDYQDIDLNAFEDEWISIPSTFSLSALAGEAPRKVSQEDFDRLAELLQTVDLVNVERTGIVEIIDGDVALPYEFVLDKEGMQAFLAAWWEIQKGSVIDAVSYQSIVERVDALDSAHGTMWIGRKSFLLHRLVVKTPDTDLRIALSDFNKPVTIEAPQEITDIRLILSDLGFNVSALPTAADGRSTGSSTTTGGTEFGALPGTEDNAAAVKANDPDEDGLGNSFEYFYGSNPNNPDTDGDGVNDGEEVRHGQNPTGKGSLFSFGVLP